MTIEPRINFIVKKVIREIEVDKNPQESLFNPKEKKFKQHLQHPPTRERYDKISLCAFLQFP
ncbi:hypothetical protein FIM44_05620 [Helicobacter pylori]|nr:hypothetical protein FIM44_05620 [Helicobacter pylori]